MSEQKIRIKTLGGGIFVFIIAFLVRLIYLFQIKEHIFIKSPVIDSAYYVQRATEILQGNLITSQPSFHSALLYPYFLASFMAVKPGGLFALFFQIFIGSITCCLIYLIGKKVFNQFSGMVSGLIAAFYGFSIFTEVQFLADFLIPFFLSVMLVVILYSNNKLTFFFAGIFLGFSALCKATMFLCVPFLIVFIFLKVRRIHLGLRHSFLLLLGIVLPMMPFAFMSYKATGVINPVSSGGGITFYVGNHANATGGFSIPKEMYPYYNNNLIETSQRLAEIETGKPMTSMQVSSFWFGKAVDFIRTNPVTTLRLVAKKFILFWNKYESTCILDFYFFQNKYTILKWLLAFSLFAPLGLLGIVLSYRHENMLLSFLLVSILLTNLLFFVLGRFRLPATLFIMLFAGYAMFTLWAQIKKKAWRSLGVSVLLLLCFYTLVNIPHFDDVKLDPGYIYSIMSSSYQIQHDREGELQALQRCLEVSPSYPFAHAKLGDIFWEMGNTHNSLSEYEKEVSINPSNANIRTELGRRYGMIGDFEKAREHLEHAIMLAPKMIEARNNLGIVYGKLKEDNRALAQFHLILEIDPTYIQALVNAGNVYRDKGDIDSALIVYQTALDIMPHNPEVTEYLRAMIQELKSGN